jgi:hypothetical protein
MPRFLQALLAALALTAALPAAAPAGPWHPHTLATGHPTFVRALDARSDHVRLLVDERHHGSVRQLELRVGNTGYHLLDSSRGTYQSVRIAHDAHGREVVAWAHAGDGGGVRHAFVWSPGGGTQELDTPRSVVSLSLSVAPDGSAALGVTAAAEVYGATGTVDGPFTPLKDLGATDGLAVAAGAGPGGGAVVAWPQAHGLAVAAAPPRAAFGAPQTATLPAPSSVVRDVTAASTPTGRTVVAAQVGVFDAGGAELSRRVDAFDWAPDQSAPSAARTLSTATGMFAGPPALVPRGETVVAGWTETAQVHTAARVLRTVRWTSGADPAAPVDYRPARGMGGSSAPLIAAPAAGTGAAQFFYRPSTASARWYTVATDAQGAPHGASSVTAPGERGDADLRATLATAPTVAWTTNVSGTSAGYRVRTAMP